MMIVRAVEIDQLIAESDIVSLAASLERGSAHPLAAAIIPGATKRDAHPADAADFQSVTGT